MSKKKKKNCQNLISANRDSLSKSYMYFMYEDNNKFYQARKTWGKQRDIIKTILGKVV